jgi:tetratricopeptide (TPR) repeat protein
MTSLHNSQQSPAAAGPENPDNMIGIGAVTRGLKPLHQAQELCHDARQAATRDKRISLAKRALALSPLCADAYTILGQYQEPGSALQLELYMTALEAGRKAIGAKFESLAGAFWERLETRPFMRAKLGLAKCLWARDKRAESLAELREMLALNPRDDQQARSVLAAFLLEERLHDEAARLLAAFPGDFSASMAFARALLAFRLQGDGPKAGKELLLAQRRNKFVRRYLVGAKKLPRKLPEKYFCGSDEEAVLYAAHCKKGWDATPGAIEWLAGFSSAQAKPASRKRAAA